MHYIVFSCIYLLVLFGISTYVFEPTYLYYELPWLDIPMHFLGGFGVAALVITIQLYRARQVTLRDILITTLCVAIGWELYEYAQDIFFHGPVNNMLDTVSDIIIGCMGAYVAHRIVKK